MRLVICNGCARHVVGAAGVLVVSSACGARTDIGAPEEEAGCTPYDAGLNVATYGLPPSPPDGSCR